MKGTLTAYLLGLASCGAIWIFKDKIAVFASAQWAKVNTYIR